MIRSLTTEIMKILGLGMIVIFATFLDQCAYFLSGTGNADKAVIKASDTATGALAGRADVDFESMAGRYRYRNSLTEQGFEFTGAGQINVSSRSFGKKGILKASGSVNTFAGDRPFRLRLVFRNGKARGVVSRPEAETIRGRGTYKARGKGLRFELRASAFGSATTYTGAISPRGRKLTISGIGSAPGSELQFLYSARKVVRR